MLKQKMKAKAKAGPSSGIARVVRYRCGFCESEYDTHQEAAQCAALGFECHIKVGDIIVGSRKYAWCEGDAPHWIYDKTDDTKTQGHLARGFRFYFVAVAVTRDVLPKGGDARLHYPVIHYVTNAMRDQGRHSDFKVYHGRHHFCNGEWRVGPLPVLPKKPKNNYGAFKPEISRIPKRVREEAAKILKTKACPASCTFVGEHRLIGWKDKGLN